MESRLFESLKKKNLRITEARKAVYDVLIASNRSLSVQSVFAKIQKIPGIKTDKVSVYRNLSLFSELGLVHKFQDGKYSACTHNLDKDRDHEHLHIIANCYQCGSTIEVNPHSKSICKSVERIKSLIKDFGHFSGVTFQGLCKNCKE